MNWGCLKPRGSPYCLLQQRLPTVKGKFVILVVVDQLSKYALFVALSHPYTTASIAQVFLDNIYKLHGLSTSIIFDRDKIFVSTF